MGWFLWGVLAGWVACTVYHHTQRGEDADTTTNGALIVMLLIAGCAIFISIGLGVMSGTIANHPPTPTPLLGR